MKFSAVVFKTISPILVRRPEPVKKQASILIFMLLLRLLLLN